MIPAFIGAAAAIGGSVMKNRAIDRQIAAQASENEKARHYNSALAAKQNQWNIEQWRRENAYNTPAAQMARMKAAGLNPDLAYGQQNLAAASPEMTAGAESPIQDMSVLGQKSTIGDIASQFAQSRLASAQAKLAESQASKVDKEAQGIDISNNWLPTLLSGQASVNKATVKEKLSSSNLSDKQIELVSEQVVQMKQAVEESKVRISDIQSQISDRTFQQAMSRLRYDLDRTKISAEVRKLLASADLDRSTIDRISLLLPYDITTAAAASDKTQAEAALTFLKQSTERLIQANHSWDQKHKAAMFDALSFATEQEKAATAFLRNGKSNEFSAVGKIFLGLSKFLNTVSPNGAISPFIKR